MTAPAAGAAGGPARGGAGLCDACVHRRAVGNTRGSVFSLCLRSKVDERYPKYPRLPVLRCAGFEPRAAGGESRPGGEPREPG